MCSIKDKWMNRHKINNGVKQCFYDYPTSHPVEHELSWKTSYIPHCEGAKGAEEPPIFMIACQCRRQLRSRSGYPVLS